MKKIIFSLFLIVFAVSNINAAQILGSTDRGDNKEISVECNSGKLVTIINYYSNNSFWYSGKQFNTINDAVNYACN